MRNVRPVLFHHIHKTAGMSLWHAIQRICQRNNTYFYHNHLIDIRHVKDELISDEDRYNYKKDGKFTRELFDLDAGHQHGDEIEDYMHVISIRDPIQRFLSLRNVQMINAMQQCEDPNWKPGFGVLVNVDKNERILPTLYKNWEYFFPTFKTSKGTFGKTGTFDGAWNFLKTDSDTLRILKQHGKLFFIRQEYIKEDFEKIFNVVHGEYVIPLYNTTQQMHTSFVKGLPRLSQLWDEAVRFRQLTWDDLPKHVKELLIQYFKREYDLLATFDVHYKVPTI